MKFYLLLGLTACMLFVSCNLFGDYGKKVEFGESEVYYKGDGVTEKDASNLGKYLKKQGYFDDKEKAVQITHDGEDYMLRFVIDEKKLTEETRLAFWKFQYNISEDVFDGKSLRIVLADQQLKDVEVLNPVALHEIDKSIIFYDNSEITKKQVKKLEEFFRGIKLAGGDKESAFFYTREEKKPVVRIVVEDLKTIKGDVLTAFAYWQALMQEKVFNNDRKAKILLTSTDLLAKKSVPTITAEQRQAFETQSTENEQTTENTINTLTTDTSSSGVLRLPNN